MIVDLVLAFEHAIDGAPAERSHAFWARVDPPVHQIEMVAVFVDEATAGLLLVLNPISGFFLERAAKFARPDHSGPADFTGANEVLDLLEKGRVSEFVP